MSSWRFRMRLVRPQMLDQLLYCRSDVCGPVQEAARRLFPMRAVRCGHASYDHRAHPRVHGWPHTKKQRRIAIPKPRGHHLEHFTFAIDCAPEIVP
jgi:hypothetical protein